MAEASFNTARRGFNSDEVRAFLVSVAAEMGRLQERERQLEAELRQAKEAVTDVELDDDTVTKMLGEETLRVLQTARESASQIRVRAEENAARTLREAAEEANRLRQDIEVEVARKRQDATSDAEAEVALAKQQGREMVNEARAYRERVLADLDRRTTLARQQIEELIHGRDRLLQVFERARLVAVDVTSELKAVDSPDELVNLAPTTGPVPIMVPHQRQPEPEPEPEPAVDIDSTDAIDVPDLTDTIDDDTQSDDLGPTHDDTVADEVPTDDPADAAETVDADDDTTAIDSDDAVDTGDAIDTDEAIDTVEIVESAEDAAETETVDVTDTDESDDSDEHDDSADAVDSPDDQADDETPSKDDTNVVSLFRGRPTPAETAVADDHPSTEVPVITDETPAPAGERTDKPDVGGIFERLRHEVPHASTTVEPDATTDAPADDPHDEVEPDEVTADASDEVEAAAAPTPFTRREEALVPLIVAGARRLKRVLADEQNEALDTLRQREPVIALDAVAPALDDHAAAYTAALAEELLEAAVAGAAEAGANDTKNLRTKLGKAGALDDAHERLRLALVTPLRDRLGRAITDGDGDNDDITKRVRAVYREWKTQHIDDELDDVFRRAFAGGLAVTVEPGTPLMWTIDPSTSACPDCEDNSLSGAVPSGDAFPTGHQAAPAHPGCRCLTLPQS
ncbi:cell division septum initiation protein DivIVA [Ilumatobacter fluminis]|uniref:Cell division septum initiation protein DivIVA n=1 Tax=Ilumatobacter fluminis TaxID=467091 RepID=A0A4R7HVH7_9ACTN|nr:cell division septum initiation protein DivIVA [Ilumatobacter fluminis]